jgi:hypothetical protein
MTFEQPIKIIVQRDEEKIEIDTHWDSSLEDYQHIFRTILGWLTFSNDQINEFFGCDENGEELKEVEELGNAKSIY